MAAVGAGGLMSHSVAPRAGRSGSASSPSWRRFAINFYFPIMPIFGALNGVRAIQRGRVIGGIIGLVLNAIGGIISLLASGLIGG